MSKRIKAKTLQTKRLKVSLKEARDDQLVDLGQDVTAVVKQAFDFITDINDKSDFNRIQAMAPPAAPPILGPFFKGAYLPQNRVHVPHLESES